MMNTQHYNPERDITETYLRTVKTWIETEHEVFVICRYLAMAGARDYFFVQTYEEFLALVKRLPVGTDIIVFKEQQLPYRGVVSSAFVQEAFVRVSNDQEYLIVTLSQEPGRKGYGVCEEGHEAMREDFEEFMQDTVAFGKCPDFTGPDNATMISASKGGIDGPR